MNENPENWQCELEKRSKLKNIPKNDRCDLTGKFSVWGACYSTIKWLADKTREMTTIEWTSNNRSWRKRKCKKDFVPTLIHLHVTRLYNRSRSVILGLYRTEYLEIRLIHLFSSFRFSLFTFSFDTEYSSFIICLQSKVNLILICHRLSKPYFYPNYFGFSVKTADAHHAKYLSNVCRKGMCISTKIIKIPLGENIPLLFLC